MALRIVARELGVAAFGTVDLLAAAAERIGDVDAADVQRRLTDEHVVDIPPSGTWVDLAARGGWTADGYLAIAMARPSAWPNVPASFRQYMQLIRALPIGASPAQIAGWAAAAAIGIARSTPPGQRARTVGALLAWTALNTDPVFAAGRQDLARAGSIAQSRTERTDPLGGENDNDSGDGAYLQALLEVGDRVQEDLFAAGDALGSTINILARTLHEGADCDWAAAAARLAAAIGNLDDTHRSRAMAALLATSLTDEKQQS